MRGLPKFFEYLLLSQERASQLQTNKLQIWQVHSQGPSKQKPMKNLGEKGAWVYRGTAQIV